MPQTLLGRWLIIAACLVGMIAIGWRLSLGKPSAERYAVAAFGGYRQGLRPPRPDDGAAEDDALPDQANEAGYRWAERHGLSDASQCPSAVKAFREGCVDWAAEQAAGR